MLIIRRIHAAYRLKGVADDKRDAAERAHDIHAERCPVARSISGSIDITTSLDYVG